MKKAGAIFIARPTLPRSSARGGKGPRPESPALLERVHLVPHQRDAVKCFCLWGYFKVIEAGVEALTRYGPDDGRTRWFGPSLQRVELCLLRAKLPQQLGGHKVYMRLSLFLRASGEEAKEDGSHQ